MSRPTDWVRGIETLRVAVPGQAGPAGAATAPPPAADPFAALRRVRSESAADQATRQVMSIEETKARLESLRLQAEEVRLANQIERLTTGQNGNGQAKQDDTTAVILKAVLEAGSQRERQLMESQAQLQKQLVDLQQAQMKSLEERMRESANRPVPDGASDLLKVGEAFAKMAQVVDQVRPANRGGGPDENMTPGEANERLRIENEFELRRMAHRRELDKEEAEREAKLAEINAGAHRIDAAAGVVGKGLDMLSQYLGPKVGEAVQGMMGAEGGGNPSQGSPQVIEGEAPQGAAPAEPVPPQNLWSWVCPHCQAVNHDRPGRSSSVCHRCHQFVDLQSVGLAHQAQAAPLAPAPPLQPMRLGQSLTEAQPEILEHSRTPQTFPVPTFPLQPQPRQDIVPVPSPSSNGHPSSLPSSPAHEGGRYLGPGGAPPAPGEFPTSW